MRRMIFAVLVGVTATSASQVRAADTLEAVKKQIHAKVSAYRTMQYRLHTVTEMENPQMSMKSTTDQTVEYQKKGDKILSRMESKMSSATKVGESKQSTEMTSLDVSDGDFHFTYTDAAGQKSATKRKVDPKNEPSPFDPMANFAMLEKYQTIKLLPEETVDGKPAFVLEMAMKDAPAGSPVGKSKLYYDKATGLFVKSIGSDDKGKPMSTTTVTDVKIDAGIPADHFVFKAPAGVNVKDEAKGD